MKLEWGKQVNKTTEKNATSNSRSRSSNKIQMIYQPERLNLSVWLSGVHLLFCWGFFRFIISTLLFFYVVAINKQQTHTAPFRFYVCVKINPKINEIKIKNTADKKTHHLWFFDWCVVLSSYVSYTDGKIVALVILYSFVNSKRVNDSSHCVRYSREKAKAKKHRVQQQETERAVYITPNRGKKEAREW